MLNRPSLLNRHQISGVISRVNRKIPRILFVGEPLSLAHVARPAMLAKWAREAGYHVDFACGDAYANIARDEGFKPLHLCAVQKEKLHHRIRQARFFYTVPDLRSYLEFDRSLINRTKPDLVVSDMRLTMDIATRQAGIPQLTLANAHWSPASPCQIPPPNGGIFATVPLALSEMVFPIALKLVYRLFSRALDVIREEAGAAPLKDIRRHYTAGTYCAYLDVPEMSPLPWVPIGHSYLGPLCWTPPGGKELELARLQAGRPLAYVSVGSTGNKSLLPLIFKSLLGAGFNVVASGIDEAHVESFAPEPNETGRRWMAHRCFDPTKSLRQASLTICHGGSGTVYQSISHGIPVICLPDNPDQGLVSQRVEQCGFGINLHARRVTVTRLNEIINHTINRRTIHTAAILGKHFLETWDVRARWIRWLAAFAEQHGLVAPEQQVKRSEPSWSLTDCDSVLS